MAVEWSNLAGLWALLAIPVLWAACLLNRSSLRRWQLLVTLLVRSLWVVLAAVCLCGPSFKKTVQEMPRQRIVVVQDSSLSVKSDSASVAAILQELCRRLPKDVDRIQLAFAADSWVPSQSPSALDQTNVQKALDRANLLTQDAAACQVILITDGRSTQGEPVAAAQRIALRGGRVDVLPVGRIGRFPPRFLRIQPACEPRVGVAATVQVSFESNLPGEGEVRLIDADGAVRDSCSIPLSGTNCAMLRFVPSKPGVQTITLELAGTSKGDSQPLAREPIDVWVQGPPRLLLCDPFPDQVESLRTALTPLGLPIDVMPSQDMPVDLGEYAAIILNDLSGAEMTQAQRQALHRFVEQQGGGLVWIGGENVDIAGWKANSLSGLLPVDLQEAPAGPDEKRPPIAICFVLDRSGSMMKMLPGGAGANVSKLALVKSSVLTSLDSLPDSAQVAVVAFDAALDEVVPPTNVTFRKEIGDLVDTIQMGGGTQMAPAIDKGLDLLESMPGQKYLVVLTDGQSAPPPFPGRGWAALAERAMQLQVAWTSIAVGANADQQLMRAMAKQANGSYYYCDQADQVPQVFIQQARAAAKSLSHKRQPTAVVPGPAFHMLAGIPADGMPPLLGWVNAAAKPGSDIILMGQENQPLLSHWRYGLGRVAAFQSDTTNVWAQHWLQWPKFSSLWTQVLQNVMRVPSDFQVRVRTSCDRSRARVAFDIRDQHDQQVLGLACSGTAVSRSSAGAENAQEVRWMQNAGGYQAEIELPQDGRTYTVTTCLNGSANGAVCYAAKFTSASPGELAATGPDWPTLRAIAEAGGGLCTEDVEAVAGGLSKVSQSSETVRQPLWPLAVMLMILLWPVDVFLRKL